MRNELVLSALVFTIISLPSNLSANSDVDTQDNSQGNEVIIGLGNFGNDDKVVLEKELFEILLERGIIEEEAIGNSQDCGFRC
jgi:hypothetical protein